MTLIEELEAAVQHTADSVGPSVVGLGRGWGVGSGVVIDTGRVLTNAHNLRHDETTITFEDGRRATGGVKAADPDLDVAVIEVDTEGIEPIRWESGEGIGGARIGRAVLALANPGGRGLRVTPGFVSSSARSFRGPRGRRIAGGIEHTAPLPRGSSGGPLVDSAGGLLGLNSIRLEGGLILAIPADEVLRERVGALGRGEHVRRARLGVAIAPPRVAKRLRRAVGLPERDGVLVRAVEEDSPAARAGIERGDLIVVADGHEVQRVDVLYEAIDAARGRGALELTLLRGNEERSVTVDF